jgi:hypothetical protein
LGEGHLGSANSQSVLKTAYIKWILDSCLQGKSVVSQVAEERGCYLESGGGKYEIANALFTPLTIGHSDDVPPTMRIIQFLKTSNLFSSFLRADIFVS